MPKEVVAYGVEPLQPQRHEHARPLVFQPVGNRRVRAVQCQRHRAWIVVAGRHGDRGVCRDDLAPRPRAQIDVEIGRERQRVDRRAPATDSLPGDIRR